MISYICVNQLKYIIMTTDPMSTNSTVLMDKYYGKLNIKKAPAVHTVQMLKKESFISKLLKIINKSR